MLNNLIKGGASKTIEKSMNNIGFFFMLIIVFFLNVMLVQWSYNKVFPILSSNMGYNGKFRPLTFGESILVVILFNSLF